MPHPEPTTEQTIEVPTTTGTVATTATGGKTISVENMIIGVVIVLAALVLTMVFALGAIVVQSEAEKKASYQNLANQVTEQKNNVQIYNENMRVNNELLRQFIQINQNKQ